jgi:hypothetical protein
MTELTTYQAPLNLDKPLMKHSIAHGSGFLYSTIDGKLSVVMESASEIVAEISRLLGSRSGFSPRERH